MSKTRTLITGAPGQDATLLSQLLLERDHDVICTYRYSSVDFAYRFRHFPLDNSNLRLVCCDIASQSGCVELVEKYEPDWIINLAAQSHVAESFKNPELVFAVNLNPIIYFLEAIKRFNPSIRFLQASTSEMFGSNYSIIDGEKRQDELTPLSGNSPYAVSKIAAHNMVKLYREAYGLFACTAISHNHESNLRGENFVTRKITKWLCNYTRWCIDNGFGKPEGFSETDILFKGATYPKLRLGNVKAVRDWSHAKDVVNAMTLIINADYPDDFVVCSEVGHSVEDFIQEAFRHVFIEDPLSYIYIDPAFYRPCDVPFLQGSSRKLREALGWRPQFSFRQLVRQMVMYDCGNSNRL